MRLADKLLEISKMDICTISEWQPSSLWIGSLVEWSRAFWEDYCDVYALNEYPTTKKVLLSGSPEVSEKNVNDPESNWMDEMGLSRLIMMPIFSK